MNMKALDISMNHTIVQEEKHIDFIQRIKARRQVMKQAAEDLIEELGLPIEAKYDVMSIIYTSPSPPPAPLDAPDRRAGCRGTSATAPSSLPCPRPPPPRTRLGAGTPALPAPHSSEAVSSCLSPSPSVVDQLCHVRNQDRQDQQGPDHARLGVAGDVGKPHSVAEVEDDENRQPHPHQIA